MVLLNGLEGAHFIITKEIYYKRGHSLAFFLVLTRDEVEVSCLPACWCPQCSAVNCLVLWMLEEWVHFVFYWNWFC